MRQGKTAEGQETDIAGQRRDIARQETGKVKRSKVKISITPLTPQGGGDVSSLPEDWKSAYLGKFILHFRAIFTREFSKRGESGVSGLVPTSIPFSKQKHYNEMGEEFGFRGLVELAEDFAVVYDGEDKGMRSIWTYFVD